MPHSVVQIYTQFMNKTTFAALLLSVLFFQPLFTSLFAQRNATYEAYIDKYKEMAIVQMHRHKIPASITLAQGLLESGAGQGLLAKEANNHFGIKCASGWTGKTFRKDDDRRDECFRSYRSVEESYEDHSKFLQRPHYSPLFDLKTTDYKGWAHGLRSCGYATDRQYAQKLIRLIEEYELYRYDRMSPTWGDQKVLQRPVYKNGKLLYVLAKQGDDLKSIAKEVGISARRLRKYNELPKEYSLRSGDIIYLQRKRARALKSYKYHQVSPGESLYSIAQRYGIRSKSLIRRNDLQSRGGSIEVRDILKLR